MFYTCKIYHGMTCNFSNTNFNTRWKNECMYTIMNNYDFLYSILYNSNYNNVFHHGKINKLTSKHLVVQWFIDFVATLTWPSVGVKPNTWKSWGFGVLRDSRMFRAPQQDPKHLALGCSWCHWKVLEA
jgi:hypothetical protein